MKKGQRLVSFNVVYELDEDGYFVSVPSIPGCYTQGKTFEEAKKRIVEVIELCLDDEPDRQEMSQPSFVGIDRVTLSYA